MFFSFYLLIELMELFYQFTDNDGVLLYDVDGILVKNLAIA